jgi:hypothetical protein
MKVEKVKRPERMNPRLVELKAALRALKAGSDESLVFEGQRHEIYNVAGYACLRVSIRQVAPGQFRVWRLADDAPRHGGRWRP